MRRTSCCPRFAEKRRIGEPSPSRKIRGGKGDLEKTSSDRMWFLDDLDLDYLLSCF